jgi:acyl dehydratase|tara:strand:+ start:333 stop:761 length:429 start_codon:yes stop_codon:yes gene_type:complete
MTTRKTLDQYEVGEELEPFVFKVTPEFNQRFIDAVEEDDPRYTEGADGGGPIVHPGLFLNQTNSTRSPSYFLPEGVAGIHAKDEVEFFAPGRVGKTFTANWKVADCYEKRGRVFRVIDCVVVDEDGVTIMRKKMTTTSSSRK